jgi:hypothetical protein
VMTEETLVFVSEQGARESFRHDFARGKTPLPVNR